MHQGQVYNVTVWPQQHNYPALLKVCRGCPVLQQLSRMGQLNLQSLLAIKESGQSIDSVPADTRTNLYSEGVRTLIPFLLQVAKLRVDLISSVCLLLQVHLGRSILYGTQFLSLALQLTGPVLHL